MGAGSDGFADPTDGGAYTRPEETPRDESASSEVMVRRDRRDSVWAADWASESARSASLSLNW